MEKTTPMKIELDGKFKLFNDGVEMGLVEEVCFSIREDGRSFLTFMAHSLPDDAAQELRPKQPKSFPSLASESAREVALFPAEGQRDGKVAKHAFLTEWNESPNGKFLFQLYPYNVGEGRLMWFQDIVPLTE